MKEDGKKYWLEKPGSANKIYWALCIVCGLLFIAEIFFDKHPRSSAEGIFGFYAIIGFVALIGLVILVSANDINRLLQGGSLLGG